MIFTDIPLYSLRDGTRFALIAQFAVRLLAGLAGNTGLVCKGANESSSFESPAEHVGIQISGAGGWRAWIGSGGMDGGCTTEGGETLAQPIIRRPSGIGISARRTCGNFSMVGLLLDGDNAAFGLRARGLLARKRPCRLLSDVVGRAERLLLLVVEMQPEASGNHEDDPRDSLKLQAREHHTAALIVAAATRAFTAASSCAWLAIVACPALICCSAAEVSAK